MILDAVKSNCLLVWGALSEQGLRQIKEEGQVVIVPENRPHLTGLRHNAPLLKTQGVRFIYCTDNMLGLLFYKRKIGKTFLFYKKLGENGIIGIAGSLYAALLSHLHGVPIKTMPQSESCFDIFDQDASSLGGKKFVLGHDEDELIIRPEDEWVEGELLG